MLALPAALRSGSLLPTPAHQETMTVGRRKKGKGKEAARLGGGAEHGSSDLMPFYLRHFLAKVKLQVVARDLNAQ